MGFVFHLNDGDVLGVDQNNVGTSQLFRHLAPLKTGSSFAQIGLG